MVEKTLTAPNLTIALPKGRLLPPTQQLLTQLGYDPAVVGNGTRKLVAADSRLPVRYLLVKPIDVPTYVQYGAADVGIVGQDVLREATSDVLEPDRPGGGRTARGRARARAPRPVGSGRAR